MGRGEINKNYILCLFCDLIADVIAKNENECLLCVNWCSLVSCSNHNKTNKIKTTHNCCFYPIDLSFNNTQFFLYFYLYFPTFHNQMSIKHNINTYFLYVYLFPFI